jgi:hypothetical protein
MPRRTKPAVIAEPVEPDVGRLLHRMKRLESFKTDAEQVICALYDRLKAVEAAARPKGEE